MRGQSVAPSEHHLDYGVLRLGRTAWNENMGLEAESTIPSS